ncbi:DUF2141 domain-containing protein, partial [Myxococcota bacterium]|nr:DUF2141 domain-containing protein [Myxococcota bacterium]
APQIFVFAVLLGGCAGPQEAASPQKIVVQDDATNARLVVHVHGISHRTGTMNVGLYRDDGTWLTGDNIAFTRVIPVPQAGSVLAVSFDEVPVGEYAVSLYHDIDANSALEQGALGIPSEPWGMSNDAIGVLAPATFQQAAFVLHPPETSIDIRLRDGLVLTSSDPDDQSK